MGTGRDGEVKGGRGRGEDHTASISKPFKP